MNDTDNIESLSDLIDTVRRINTKLENLITKTEPES